VRAGGGARDARSSIPVRPGRAAQRTGRTSHGPASATHVASMIAHIPHPDRRMTGGCRAACEVRRHAREPAGRPRAPRRQTAGGRHAAHTMPHTLRTHISRHSAAVAGLRYSADCGPCTTRPRAERHVSRSAATRRRAGERASSARPLILRAPDARFSLLACRCRPPPPSHHDTAQITIPASPRQHTPPSIRRYIEQHARAVCEPPPQPRPIESW